MTEQYKNLWRDRKDKSSPQFIMEGVPSEDLDGAISDYNNEVGAFEYCGTLVWNLKQGTIKSIDIEDIIEEKHQEDNRFYEREMRDLRLDRAYYSDAQRGRGW